MPVPGFRVLELLSHGYTTIYVSDRFAFTVPFASSRCVTFAVEKVGPGDMELERQISSYIVILRGRSVYRYTVGSLAFDAARLEFNVRVEDYEDLRDLCTEHGIAVAPREVEFIKKRGSTYYCVALKPLSDLPPLEGVGEPAQPPAFIEEVDERYARLVKSSLKGEGEQLAVYAVRGSTVFTENALLHARVAEDRGGRLYIDRRILPYMRFAVYHRLSGYPLACLDATSSAVEPLGFAELKRWRETWTTALTHAVRPPPVELSVRVQELPSSVKGEVLGADFEVSVVQRPRYVLAEVKTKLPVGVEPVYAFFEQLGFSKGEYGGYIRRRQLSDSERRTIAEGLRAQLENLLPAIVEAVTHKLDVEFRERCAAISKARAAVGINLPPTEPVPAEAVLALLGLEPVRPAVEARVAPPQPAPPAQPESVQQPVQQLLQPQPPAPRVAYLVVSTLPSVDVLKGRLEGRGWFFNRLKSLSRKFYTQILPQHARETSFGYVVLPEALPRFIEAVEALRREYEDYERKMNEFIATGSAPQLEPRAIADIKVLKRERVDIVSRFSVKLVPILLSPEFVEGSARRWVEELLLELARGELASKRVEALKSS